jgi:polar amino acid transport system substrate-binding protein
MAARLLSVAILLLSVAFSAACGGEGNGSSGDTLERVRESGTIRIGYANEAPYAYRDTATGQLTGEAPEIARVILARMGVSEVEGVLTEFGSLIPGLNAGRFDMIAAGMYILPDRCLQVNFSEPTYGIGEALMVRAGNPKGLHGYTEIRDHDDATIGVVSGAIQRNLAREMGIPESRIIVFPDAPSAVAGVKSGRVDAYGGTALTVQDLLDKEGSGDLERADPFTDPVVDGVVTRGYGAFAFRKGDDPLLAEFNRHLMEFIGSPEHLELVRQFGFTEAELPGDVSTAQLCGGG